MKRTVKKMVKGFITHDGAGVKLVRVLSGETVKDYDPILMLDSFDSLNPSDYIKGFPLHPHRGIETISYVYHGKMMHRDSIGNSDTIADGEVQWMTAGSGIMHEEQIPASKRMLGVQLWLNLPRKDKMCPPHYHAIKNADIKEIKFENGFLRLLAGTYLDNVGYKSSYLPLDFYDIHLNKGASLTIKTPKENSIMLFTLLGKAYVEKTLITPKTAAKLSSGDEVTIKASDDEDCQVLFVSSLKLDEPVAWGGPIVMNSKEELYKAFDDLDNGTFIKEKIEY